MPVKVKVLRRLLIERHGEYMHVADHIAEAGEQKGLWVRVIQGTIGIETAEMVPETKGKYETKIIALSKKDISG